jgi:PspAA-like protein
MKQHHQRPIMKKKTKANAKARKVVARSKLRHTGKTMRLVHKTSRPKKSASSRIGQAAKKVVRIMGHGQFTIDARTLKRLNNIDNALVEMAANEKSDDAEFKKKLAELNQIAIEHGKIVQSAGIVKTDIILPSADLPVDEAKKLFIGEGVIPENQL